MHTLVALSLPSLLRLLNAALSLRSYPGASSGDGDGAEGALLWNKTTERCLRCFLKGQAPFFNRPTGGLPHCAPPILKRTNIQGIRALTDMYCIHI